MIAGIPGVVVPGWTPGQQRDIVGRIDVALDLSQHQGGSGHDQRHHQPRGTHVVDTQYVACVALLRINTGGTSVRSGRAE